jgi:hypothetical protein
MSSFVVAITMKEKAVELANGAMQTRLKRRIEVLEQEMEQENGRLFKALEDDGSGERRYGTAFWFTMGRILVHREETGKICPFCTTGDRTDCCSIWAGSSIPRVGLGRHVAAVRYPYC